MSLARAVASYLSVWEGHSPLTADSYIRVMDLLPLASIEEIVTEMNALTQQQLWNESLIDLFHDELLKRIDTDTTFAISAIWRVGDQNPSVLIWLGFEDSYLLIDEQGELIRQDDSTIYSYTLTNASFQDPVTRRLIHLLIDGPVDLTVQLEPITITTLSSRTDPSERVDFQSATARTVQLPALIRETPSFNLVKRMYQSVKSSRPIIIDIYSDRLIEQLIDYREAQDIVEDNGDTFEGPLFLTGTGVDDQEDDEGDLPSLM